MKAVRWSWFSHCLISGIVGTAGGRVHWVGAGLRRNGFPSTGEFVGGSVGALVLIGRRGLLYAGPSVITGHRIGVRGSGILIAIHWISALASWSCRSRVDTRSW